MPRSPALACARAMTSWASWRVSGTPVQVSHGHGSGRAAPSQACGRDFPTSGGELPWPATSHRLATNLLSGLRDSRVPLTFLGGPEGHVRGGGNRAARPYTVSREAIRRGHLFFLPAASPCAGARLMRP